MTAPLVVILQWKLVLVGNFVELKAMKLVMQVKSALIVEMGIGVTAKKVWIFLNHFPQFVIEFWCFQNQIVRADLVANPLEESEVMMQISQE